LILELFPLGDLQEFPLPFPLSTPFKDRFLFFIFFLYIFSLDLIDGFD